MFALDSSRCVLDLVTLRGDRSQVGVVCDTSLIVVSDRMNTTHHYIWEAIRSVPYGFFLLLMPRREKPHPSKHPT